MTIQTMTMMTMALQKYCE